MKYFAGVVAAALASGGIASASPVPFKNCGTSNDPFQISTLDVNPYPILKGQNVAVTASGNLAEEVTAGKYQVDVYYLGIKVITETGDLCTLDPQFTCPHQPGTVSIQKSLNVPSIAPSGKFTIHISATDQNDKTLFCTSADVQITTGATNQLDLAAPAISKAIVEQVNGANVAWTAGYNARFAGKSLSDAKRLCGSKKSNEKRLPTKEFSHTLLNALAIPDNFDSRQEWPQCATIQEIRDQANCGSCWAFGAAEAMSDRICVASNGTVTPHLAAQDVLSCCASCGDGCDGGFPEAAWEYFHNVGLVTGGNYDSNQGCLPYSIASCDHHVVGKLPPCSGDAPTPACTKKCSNGGLNWSEDKHFGASAYNVPASVKAIQSEILLHGPVEGAFTVFEDFISYKSGVYHHTTGQELGGHAIKVLGWGVENNVPYWLCANSWNEDWGDKGFFKIRRGNNECGIESEIVAGLVKL